MTSEQAEAYNLIGAIEERQGARAWLDREASERDRLAAERQAVQKIAEQRAPDYARAKAAAEAWVDATNSNPHRGDRPALVLHPDAERLQRHAVDLAMESPPVALHWLTFGTQSTRLVGVDNAMANVTRLSTVCPPIIDLVSAVRVGHEIAHNRDEHTAGTIAREVWAWRECRRRALIWNRGAQDYANQCLGTYLANASHKDVWDVMDAEAFFSAREFRVELQRRVLLECK